MSELILKSNKFEVIVRISSVRSLIKLGKYLPIYVSKFGFAGIDRTIKMFKHYRRRRLGFWGFIVVGLKGKAWNK